MTARRVTATEAAMKPAPAKRRVSCLSLRWDGERVGVVCGEEEGPGIGDMAGA